MNQEPDWEKCPPDWDDFPNCIITAMSIFNSLGDRIYPDIGYIGKDYTNYNFLLELYKVEKHEVDYIFEVITTLENRAVEIAQRKLKAQYDKLKRK